jgi:hypothetical protein
MKSAFILALAATGLVQATGDHGCNEDNCFRAIEKPDVPAEFCQEWLQPSYGQHPRIPKDIKNGCKIGDKIARISSACSCLVTQPTTEPCVGYGCEPEPTSTEPCVGYGCEPEPTTTSAPPPCDGYDCPCEGEHCEPEPTTTPAPPCDGYDCPCEGEHCEPEPTTTPPTSH